MIIGRSVTTPNRVTPTAPPSETHRSSIRTESPENNRTAATISANSFRNNRVSTGNPGPDATGHASRRCNPTTPGDPGVILGRTRKCNVGPCTTTARNVSHGKNAGPCPVGTRTPARSTVNDVDRRFRRAKYAANFNTTATTDPTNTTNPTNGTGHPTTSKTTPTTTPTPPPTNHGRNGLRHAASSTSASNSSPTPGTNELDMHRAYCRREPPQTRGCRPPHNPDHPKTHKHTHVANPPTRVPTARTG